MKTLDATFQCLWCVEVGEHYELGKEIYDKDLESNKFPILEESRFWHCYNIPRTEITIVGSKRHKETFGGIDLSSHFLWDGWQDIHLEDCRLLYRRPCKVLEALGVSAEAFNPLELDVILNEG